MSESNTLQRPDYLSNALGRMAGHFGPLILMYHSVEEGSSPPEWQWAVSFRQFREQIDYLISEGWSFMTLDRLRSGRPRLPKQVVITFDDAYVNTLQAADLLNQAGLRASWFVVSSALGGQATWRDQGAPQLPTLRPAQLRELAATGMEVGAHSRTHRRMAEISPTELGSETAACKSEIEDALGRPIASFSYPYGSYNAAVIEAVRQAGYELACTTDNGTANEGAERLVLPRLAITADNTISEFARKLFLVSDFAGIRGLVRSARRGALIGAGSDPR
jgi:peptidoglycan/xylan/chitin deacetylase (PgdA/CDA1 family)